MADNRRRSDWSGVDSSEPAATASEDTALLKGNLRDCPGAVEIIAALELQRHLRDAGLSGVQAPPIHPDCRIGFWDCITTKGTERGINE